MEAQPEPLWMWHIHSQAPATAPDQQADTTSQHRHSTQLHSGRDIVADCQTGCSNDLSQHNSGFKQAKRELNPW